MNFHLTVLACGSAASFMVPPLAIPPGVTVRLGMLDGCEIPGAAVAITSSGFMNRALFVECLGFFSRSVLVLLPSNAIHFLQPLDGAVFVAYNA